MLTPVFELTQVKCTNTRKTNSLERFGEFPKLRQPNYQADLFYITRQNGLVAGVNIYAPCLARSGRGLGGRVGGVD